MALANRSVVALAVVAIILLSIFAVPRIQQELIPEIEFPVITVFTRLPDASPDGADGVADLGPQVAGSVVPELESIDGVSAVTLTGLESRELRVALRPQALAEVPQVDPASLFSAIQTANV